MQIVHGVRTKEGASRIACNDTAFSISADLTN